MKLNRIRHFFIGLIFLGTATAFAQSSPNIPIDDPVYRDIDRLVSFGLAPDVIYGQRPWSRTEIARIISNAAIKFKETESPLTPAHSDISWSVGAREVMERLQKRFQEELSPQKTFSVHPLSFVRGEASFVDADARAIPATGLGLIDSTISPLTAYREGRHFPDGAQFAVETEHYARATRYFSAYVRPRFQTEIHDNQNVSFNPFIQQLYGKLTIPHFEIEAGRDSIEWGQGEFGGILLSNNARPLDMIKLSNPSPTILPWIFKYFGPFRYTLFVANLGPEREFPHSFLTGLKLSIKPAAFLELGIDQLLMLGGTGAPGPLSFGNVLQEFIGFRVGDVNTLNLTNREIGFDMRCFFPFLRNSQLYLDAQIEDLSSLSYMILNTISYQSGFYIPRLSSDGTTSLRMEYHHGSPYFARHGTFVTGMSLNRRVLGDEIGAQGDGVYVNLNRDFFERLSLIFAFDYERRSGNVLDEVFNANGDRDRLVTVASFPPEHRIRADVGGRYRLSDRMTVDLNLQYLFTRNFNFQSSVDRNGYLFQAGVRWDLF